MSAILRRFSLSFFALIFSAVSICTDGSAQEGAHTDSPRIQQSASRASLEYRLYRVGDDIDLREKELDAAKSFKLQIEQRMPELSASQDFSKLDDLIEGVKKSLANISRIANEGTKDPSPHARALSMSINALVQSTVQTVDNARGHILDRSSFYPEDNRVSIFLNDVVGHTPTKDVDVIAECVPSIREVSNLLGNAYQRFNMSSDSIAEVLPPGLLVKAQTEANALNSSALISAANKVLQNRKTHIDSIAKALDQKIFDTDQKLKAAVGEYDKLNNQVLDRENVQEKVSGYLLHIFYGSVGLTIGMLVILRFKPDRTSRLLISERTGIEAVAIALFLVTILFLGTGGFIEKATLGTLLGTLAGYLFTRRPSPNGDSDAKPVNDQNKEL